MRSDRAPIGSTGPVDGTPGGLIDDPPIKFLPLGGLGEIGMNCALVGTENRYVLLDAGLMFPDHEELGIQKVLPDVSFLSRWKDKIEAVLITHGHEDHIGALPWVIPALDPSTPVYAGLFTMQLIARRMKEFNLWGDGSRFKVIGVGDGSRFSAGPFEMEAVRVTHSIPDCCGLIFRCAAGTIVHTGDWKIDENPVDGLNFDRSVVGTRREGGRDAHDVDSTNVLSPGRTISESTSRAMVAQASRAQGDGSSRRSSRRTFTGCTASRRRGRGRARKIAFVGMSSRRTSRLRSEAGIAPIDPETLIPAEEIDNVRPERAHRRHDGVAGGASARSWPARLRTEVALLTLQPDDLLLYSAKMIPGNEKRVMRMMNAIAVRGAGDRDAPRGWLALLGARVQGRARGGAQAACTPSTSFPCTASTRFSRAHEQLARESASDTAR